MQLSPRTTQRIELGRETLGRFTALINPTSLDAIQSGIEDGTLVTRLLKSRNNQPRFNAGIPPGPAVLEEWPTD
jgi:hypothetical protein